MAASPTDLAMARDLVSELQGPVEVRVSHTEPVRRLNVFVRRAVAAQPRADAVATVAEALSVMGPSPAGNTLSEIYIRVRRFIFTFPVNGCDDPTPDGQVPCTWFRALTNPCVSLFELTADYLWIGLGCRRCEEVIPPDRESEIAWHDIVGMLWWSSGTRVLTCSEAQHFTGQEVTQILAKTYLDETGYPAADTSERIGPVTSSPVFQSWWLKAQAVLNAPLCWLCPGRNGVRSTFYILAQRVLDRG